MNLSKMEMKWKQSGIFKKNKKWKPKKALQTKQAISIFHDIFTSHCFGPLMCSICCYLYVDNEIQIFN